MFIHNNEYDCEIKNILEKHPQKYYCYIKKKQYLINYLDSICNDIRFKNFRLCTKIYWLFNGIEDFPICQNENCQNKIIRNTDNWHSSKGYIYCCEKCAHTSKIRAAKAVKTFKKHCMEDETFLPNIQQKIKNTNMINRGVEYVFQDPIFISESKKTKQKNFGIGKLSNPDKARKTRYAKNNGKWASDEQIEKTKNTNNKLYGVDYPLQSQEIYDKTIQSFKENHNGISCIFNDINFQLMMKENQQEIVDKRNKTKLKNGTFNTSNDEEQVYKMLCIKYGSENVKRQYKSVVYPFRCDFYITSYDLYIECNFHWTHCQHFFDKTNSNDIKKLDQLKSKNTKYYNIAIYVWTISDVKKLQCAKMNNLNYIVFWNMNDVEKFILSNC